MTVEQWIASGAFILLLAGLIDIRVRVEALKSAIVMFDRHTHDNESDHRDIWNAIKENRDNCREMTDRIARLEPRGRHT